MVLEYRRVTIAETAQKLNVTEELADSGVYDSIAFYKVCARWMPGK